MSAKKVHKKKTKLSGKNVPKKKRKTSGKKKRILRGKDVCSSGWHGVHGSTVTLKNTTQNSITVSVDSTLSWPFPHEPETGFLVHVGVPKTVVLADVPTHNPTPKYGYDTKGCPGDHLDVNPKTVIIG